MIDMFSEKLCNYLRKKLDRAFGNDSSMTEIHIG
jgi:hypothetical protein